MNESTQATGGSKFIQTATASDIGTIGGVAKEAENKTGDTEASSKTSPKPTAPSTKRGRKTDPLPQVDLLSILQDAMRNLQASGMPVSVVNLPVPPGQQPRVALLLEGVYFEAGNFSLMRIEATS